MPAQSVTFAAKAGQEIFSTPFPVNSGSDATVTVNGVTAPFAAIGYGIDLVTPVATDGHLVVVTQTVSGAVSATAVAGGVNGNSALTLTGACLPIGGSDGTLARMLSVRTNGYADVFANGPNTSGVTSGGGGGLMVGGSDGTNYRHIRLDTNGNTSIIGALVPGTSAGSSNGLMVGGTDGTNYRSLSVNTSGQLNLNGAVAGNTAGAATDIGFRNLAWDGATHRLLRSNGSGQLQIDATSALGVAHTSVGILVAGSDGTNARAIRTDTSGNIANYETRRTVFQNETTTSLGASATFTGTSRDAGVAAGASYWGSYFSGFFLANQVGTAYIEGSNDNATWYIIATAPIAVSTPLILQVPVMTRYHRVRVVNGAAAQTSFFVNSSYGEG